MDIDAWLTAASEDARRRGLNGLPTLLETLARATKALRDADDTLRAEQAQSPDAAREDAP